jgi:hypothetical protein
MTGQPRRLRRLPLPIRKAAHLDRSAYNAERKALLALLHTEAAAQRASVLALLSNDTTQKISAARARYTGAELTAALDTLFAEHIAAERALVLRLGQAAAARRRVLLAALREKRKTLGSKFHTAAHTHARQSRPAPESHTQARPRLRPRLHTRKPRR